ncbi:MAG: heavy metal translocating P-type ATPase [Oscillospiraceae bacterium]|jgi:Cd2+/Zn2+-exporting ATPase|nr:heavy metal translocating P-type ATPase [Oscillospiraceae bacterium]
MSEQKHSCSCGQCESNITKKEAESTEEGGFSQKLKLALFIAGAVISGAAFFFGKGTPLRFVLFLAGYLAIGYDILLECASNIRHGRIFDETFLMAIASVCAMIIGEYPEAVAVVFLYSIGEYLQELAAERSRRSITALLDLRPDFVNVVNGTQTEKVPPEQVPVGTIIAVNPGERVPLDGAVVSGSGNIDTSAITGESAPAFVAQGDGVLSGCVSLDGVIHIRTTATASESTVARILSLVESESENKAKSVSFVTKFASLFTKIVVACAVVIAVLPPLLFRTEFSVWISRALVFLVASCPCAIVISVPLAYFAGIGAASRVGALVRGGEYLDKLAAIEKIAFDKTGTLTDGRFSVDGVYPAGESALTRSELLLLACAVESGSSHPIALAVREECAEYGAAQAEVSDYREIAGMGVTAVCCGELVAAGNAKLFAHLGLPLPESDSDGKTSLHIAKNGVFCGTIAFSDKLRREAKPALETLTALGVRQFAVLSGDKKEAVSEAAARLGIENRFAELLPQDKLRIVKELKENGSVAFVGDGINDAPVLVAADVGISMGGLGRDAAIEASDIVLLGDDLSSIPAAMKIARRTKNTATANIVFALAVKAVVLVLGVLGIAAMWMAVLADVGVALLLTGNSMLILWRVKAKQ